MAEQPALDVAELISVAKSGGPDKFAERFPHPFLSHVPLPDGGADTPPGWQTLNGSPEDKARAAALATAAAVQYLPLIHRPKSTYSGFLSVGRAENCDLVLKEPTISKMHALFWIPRVSDAWLLADGRSRNGTFLNGARLEPLAKRALRSGDVIRFGDLPAQFWMAKELFKRLSSLAGG